MSYITNIDTLSALLDRLISENIKLHFFRKEDVVDDTKETQKVSSIFISSIFKNVLLAPVSLPNMCFTK